MRNFTVSLGLVFLAACQTTPYSTADAEADSPLLTEDRRLFLLSELERQKRLWAENVPQKYSYQITTECFCFPAPARGPNEIRVENNIILSRIYLGNPRDGYTTGTEISENLTGSVAILDVFNSIERHLGPPEQRFGGPDVVVNFTVDYDSIWGFPNKIFYDAVPVVDEQYTLTIEDFTAIQ